MSSSRPLGIKKASSAYLKLISAALVTMSISVQSANAQKSSITLENALAAKVINDAELVQLSDYNKKREKAIRVDEFDFDMNILDDNAQPVNPLKSVVNQ